MLFIGFIGMTFGVILGAFIVAMHGRKSFLSELDLARALRNKNEAITRNGRIKRLAELIEIYNNQGVLKEEFQAFIEHENEIIAISDLIHVMEDEMSYWEPESED